MEKFTFHVVGLPHTYTSKEFLTCAFTQKILNFCKMMKSLGHTVYHYGGELSEVECDEHITIMSESERQEYFGHADTKKTFYPIKWDANQKYWRDLNNRAMVQIKQRGGPKDFVCIIGGNCQKALEEGLEQTVVEFGIGYEGSFAQFRVFESYTWMHYTYGKIDRSDNGRFFDAVIPNYWDLDDFVTPARDEKPDPYLFFIGRMIERKGVGIAVEVAKKLGMKIKLAGQGLEKVGENEYQGAGFRVNYEGIEYLGSVGVRERANLLFNADAVLVPTTYLEPFGGVVVEAMLAGTPAITTDFGAFPELVIDGFNGYRFRTLGEAVQGVVKARDLDREAIQRWAERNFCLERVSHMYQAYFEQLSSRWEDGFYTMEVNDDAQRYRKV